MRALFVEFVLDFMFENGVEDVSNTRHEIISVSGFVNFNDSFDAAGHVVQFVSLLHVFFVPIRKFDQCLVEEALFDDVGAGKQFCRHQDRGVNNFATFHQVGATNVKDALDKGLSIFTFLGIDSGQVKWNHHNN